MEATLCLRPRSPSSASPAAAVAKVGISGGNASRPVVTIFDATARTSDLPSLKAIADFLRTQLNLEGNVAEVGVMAAMSEGAGRRGHWAHSPAACLLGHS